LYKDRPTTALETAIHWVEYVGRHHGARYKTAKAQNRLCFYEHLMLDVIVIDLIALAISIKLLWLLIKKSFTTCVRQSDEDSSIKTVKEATEEKRSDKKISNGDKVNGNSRKQDVTRKAKSEKSVG
jgi:hypothetical protein